MGAATSAWKSSKRQIVGTVFGATARLSPTRLLWSIRVRLSHRRSVRNACGQSISITRFVGPSYSFSHGLPSLTALQCYYLMYFDQNMIIDATRGSIARFVNHSCEPNCRMEKWTVAGKPRMALFAGDRGIMTGEELTYDYNFE